MASRKILYVCQEIMPYLPETELSALSRHLAQAMQERGNEIRTFMPRYGCVNERRNQLHEVIRLSGMNLIIDDNDHQLIIKVASIPSARIQIYFIDNDDYFARKAALTDSEGEEFADNDERAIFFARGVLETVRKLNWSPSIVHCMGWMSAVMPIYLKKVFNDDPLFRDVKVVVSLCDDKFSRPLDANFKTRIANEGVEDEKLEELTHDKIKCATIVGFGEIFVEAKLMTLGTTATPGGTAPCPVVKYLVVFTDGRQAILTSRLAESGLAIERILF